MKRLQVIPLHLPADIYAVLSRLKIGEQVPLNVLICDYKDNTIPLWTVREIEASGDALVLTLCDESIIYPASLLDPEHCVACDVITLPTKTLSGPFYSYHPGCVHARNPLADIRQHARQMVDRSKQSRGKDVA